MEFKMIYCEMHENVIAYSHVIWGNNDGQQGNLCELCIKELWEMVNHGHTCIWIQSPPK